MASITINQVPPRIPASTEITGEEKLITISGSGKPTTVSVNQLLDKVDDGIVDRIDDQVIEKIEDQIDEIIDDRLENIDPNNNLKWNDV